jgi:hypothetical protein
MPKQAISVTLRDDNLLWLRGRSRAARHRSVSETLDRLIADARAGVRASDAPRRSVKGTIRIVSGDPSLARADRLVRAMFRTGRGRRLEPARKRKMARG